MKIKGAFNFYLNSSLHVALGVVAFSMITYLNFRIAFDPELLWFIFFATVTGYNFIKFALIAKLRYFELSRNLRFIKIFSLLCFIGLVISLFFQSLEVLITGGILGIITMLYALPVLRSQGNLRGIPGLKIYIIALVLAGVTVILPLLERPGFPAQDHIIDFFQRFLIAVVLMLPFEIRDMHIDNIKLNTLPQKLGVLKTRTLGGILTLIFCAMEFIKAENNIAYSISLVLLGILCIFFLQKATVNRGVYFASFWVEAAPVFWLGIFYVLPRII